MSTKQVSRSKTASKSSKSSSRAMTKREEGAAMDRRARIQALAATSFREHVKGVESGETKQLEGSETVDKASLEGVPFVILDVLMKEGSFENRQTGEMSMYAIVTCQLEDDSVVVFTDGGTGIIAALEGIEPPLFIPGGLRVSRYTNKYGDGETWYLNPNKNRAVERSRRNGVEERARA